MSGIDIAPPIDGAGASFLKVATPLARIPELKEVLSREPLGQEPLGRETPNRNALGRGAQNSNPAQVTSGSTYAISVVGGGGKSAFIYRFAQLLRAQGLAVGITTTTKMEQNHPLGGVVDKWIIGAVPRTGMAASVTSAPASVAPVHKSIDTEALHKDPLHALGSVTLLARTSSGGKWYGYDPSRVEQLQRLGMFDVLLVEADGSAGVPLKCPKLAEPVIPSTSNMVVGVLGLSAMGKTPSEKTIHRFDEFCQLPGVDTHAPISLTTYDLLFDSPRGIFKGSPERAVKLCLCNQIDTLSHEIAITLVAGFRKRGYYGVALLPS